MDRYGLLLSWSLDEYEKKPFDLILTMYGNEVEEEPSGRFFAIKPGTSITIDNGQADVWFCMEPENAASLNSLAGNVFGIEKNHG